MTRNAGTGSAFPFRSSGGSASDSTAAPASIAVSRPMITSPGAAACSNRAATFTASPVTIRCRSDASPATRCPVFTPMRCSTRTPRSSAGPMPRSSHAARTARRASSSRRRSIPNTAITASPMYDSTMPPCCSRMPRASAKWRPIASCRASGPGAAPAAATGRASAKTIVTVRRVSRPAPAAWPGAAGATHGGSGEVTATSR